MEQKNFLGLLHKKFLENITNAISGSKVKRIIFLEC
jgi:hypothetical protein